MKRVTKATFKRIMKEYDGEFIRDVTGEVRGIYFLFDTIPGDVEAVLWATDTSEMARRGITVHMGTDAGARLGVMFNLPAKWFDSWGWA